MIRKNWLLAVSAGAVLALGVAACGGDDDDSGSDGGDSASGLSGNDPHRRVEHGRAVELDAPPRSSRARTRTSSVTVGTAGTSGGFEKFCAGETDANDASRQIEPEEKKTCAKNGIDYEEVQVANDALSVIVNPNNPLTCITVDSA